MLYDTPAASVGLETDDCMVRLCSSLKERERHGAEACHRYDVFVDQAVDVCACVGAGHGQEDRAEPGSSNHDVPEREVGPVGLGGRPSGQHEGRQQKEDAHRRVVRERRRRLTRCRITRGWRLLGGTRPGHADQGNCAARVDSGIRGTGRRKRRRQHGDDHRLHVGRSKIADAVYVCGKE